MFGFVFLFNKLSFKIYESLIKHGPPTGPGNAKFVLPYLYFPVFITSVALIFNSSQIFAISFA